VLGIYISEERNMLVAEKFIRSLVAKYGNHLVYNSQRDGKSKTSIRFDFNSNGNNINEYISSSSFWNWINDISKRVKS